MKNVDREALVDFEETKTYRRSMHTKLKSVVHPGNYSTWILEARESTQGQPQLHSRFEANLGYLRYFQKELEKHKL